MNKTLLLSLAAAGSLLCAGAAQARVAWSIGIDVPGVETVVSNGPLYAQVPRVYVAPPVVYAPVPRYVPAPVVRYEPAPVGYYEPAPVGYYEPAPYYRPEPVVVYPERARHGWRDWDRYREFRHDHEHDHDHPHDDRGDRDGRWDGHR